MTATQKLACIVARGKFGTLLPGLEDGLIKEE
jgi:hypothetical protein